MMNLWKRGERAGYALKRIGEPRALGRNAQISSRALPREGSSARCADESPLLNSSSRSSFRMLLRTMCSALSSSFTVESGSECARRAESWWSGRGSSVSWARNVVCTKRAASAPREFAAAIPQQSHAETAPSRVANASPPHSGAQPRHSRCCRGAGGFGLPGLVA
jgi:hypothetical protein